MRPDSGHVKALESISLDWIRGKEEAIAAGNAKGITITTDKSETDRFAQESQRSDLHHI